MFFFKNLLSSSSPHFDSIHELFSLCTQWQRLLYAIGEKKRKEKKPGLLGFQLALINSPPK